MDRPILIAYDGSKDAQAAIAEAGEVLSPGPALVTTVWHSAEFLLPRSGGVVASYAPVLDQVDEMQRAEAQELADDGVARARKVGFEVAPLAARSNRDVWRAILDIAAERNARVIVVGCRGQGAVKDVLLGGVSRRIVHHADRPVLVARTSASS